MFRVLERGLDIHPLSIGGLETLLHQGAVRMMSKPHFTKSLTSFCASLMMNSTMVSSRQAASSSASSASAVLKVSVVNAQKGQRVAKE